MDRLDFQSGARTQFTDTMLDLNPGIHFHEEMLIGVDDTLKC